MDPSVYVGQVNALTFDSAPEAFGSSTKLYGDEAVTKAVIENTAAFLGEIGDEDNQAILNQAKGQLTLEKCAILMLMIKEHPLLSVVENEDNKEPSGSIRVTHKHNDGLNAHQITAAMTDEGQGGVRHRTNRLVVTRLGISKQAMESVLRCAEKLQQPKPQPRRTYQAIPYTPPARDYFAPKPNRTCSSCTLL